MARYKNESDLRAEIRAKASAFPSLRQAAPSFGICPSHLFRVLQGTKAVTPKLARRLGYTTRRVFIRSED